LLLDVELPVGLALAAEDQLEAFCVLLDFDLKRISRRFGCFLAPKFCFGGDVFKFQSCVVHCGLCWFIQV